MESLERRINLIWRCDCTPYRAIYKGWPSPKLMLVHSVSCARDRFHRVTQTLRISPQEVDVLKSVQRGPNPLPKAAGPGSNQCKSGTFA
jgi:hypothetical protein